MKKAPRVIIRVSAGVAVLVLGLLLLGLEGVDYRPYLREPYYAATERRLHASEATNHLARGELAAGFGRALLTPTLNAAQDDPAHGQFRSLPLAGYGDRHGRPATGAHDDLWVKAIALKVGDQLGVMVGADALIIPPEVTEAAAARLKAELGLTREQIYLAATHTHSSLGGWGEGKVAEAFAGPFVPGVRVWFANRIVAAVRDAVADLRPASFGHDGFAAREFIRNRLVGDLGKVDPEFSFAVFKQATGKIAVLGSFSAHATVLSGKVMEFSADYPGCWERAVEKATGGMGLFLAGAVGSHSPVPGEPGFDGTEHMGQALAEALLQRLSTTPLTNAIAFGCLGAEVLLPPLNVRITDGLRLRPWLARRVLPVRDATFVQGFRLDNLVWLSTPCDFSGELALGIKDYLKAKGSAAVVTSFNGDYIGYVIPARYYHLDGYEPRLMSFFGPNVPDYTDGLLREIALKLFTE